MPIEPQSVDAIAARLMKEQRGKTGRAARAARHQPQGLLHRPREMGARQGLSRTCASTASTCRPRPLAAPRPLQRAHDRAAGGRGRRRRRRTRSALRDGARARARDRQGRGARLLRRLGRPRDADLLDQARLPARAAAASRSSTRASSRTTPSTAGARRATARASQIDEVEWDDERAKTGTEDHVLDSWIEWLEIDEPCPECEGKRLNRRRSRCAGAARSIADYERAADLGCAQRSSRSIALDRPRAGDRARHPGGARARAWASSSRSASATSRSTARRRRSRAARRSASGSRRSSAPTCAASATSSTSRPSACISATTRSCSTCSQKLERQGQLAGGGRARRGHDPPRRST